MNAIRSIMGWSRNPTFAAAAVATALLFAAPTVTAQWGLPSGLGDSATDTLTVPTLSVSTVGDGSVVLKWTESNGATSYRYQVKVAGAIGWSSWISTRSADLQYTVTGLKNGLTHEFRVRAVQQPFFPWMGSTVLSDPSNMVSATPTDGGG